MRRASALACLAVLLGTLACAPRRPESAPTAARMDSTPEERNGILRLGGSWLAREGEGDGILVGRFEGEPYALGYAFGRLARPRIRAQESHLERLFLALVPNGLARLTIRQLSAFRLRHLDREIPPDLVLSIAGVADGYEPSPPAAGWNAYRRMLDLHALHDVSQRFIDAPALASACTGFVVPGFLARNFDFEGGDIFDREKIVSVAVPAGKIPYLSVGFAGMLGVVSGFNREGIGVAVNAISGGEIAGSAEPMTLLLADVLRSESTFDGAVERIRRARVFVSDLILLADGKTGRHAILEKTPHAFAVREARADEWLGATNEPESQEARKVSRPLPAGSTSRARRARLDELLARARIAGPLDAARAAAILRDRKGVGDVDLGPGNRNAIDALIAAHSVVFDLPARRAWVAAAPHTLGAYVPVDLDAVVASRSGPPPVSATPIPADPFLVEGWPAYLDARASVLEGAREIRRKKPGWQARARDALERAHRLSPDFAEASACLGDLAARAGDRVRALTLLDEALARRPAPEPFRLAVRRLRDAVASGAGLPRRRLPIALVPDEIIAERR